MAETKEIKQSVTFDATPKEVYETLMDSEKHSIFTGGEAKISKKVGGKFSVYDGYATGKNLKLVPGKLIVQEWAASDWPKGHKSKVIFEFEAKGKKTVLSFTHEGVPAEQYADIQKGWEDFYWKPMKKLFQG